MKSAGQVSNAKAVKGLVSSTLGELAGAIERAGREVLDVLTPKDWFGLVNRAAASAAPKAIKASRFAASAGKVFGEAGDARCRGAADLICKMYRDPAKHKAACGLLAGLTKNIFENIS